MKNKIKNSLDKKFSHRTLYMGSTLTMRDFIELCAENPDCFLEVKEEYKSDNLLDEPIRYNVLTFAYCRCQVRLDEVQTNYYNVRKKFWDKWDKDHENISCFSNEYIQLKHKVVEYHTARCKLKF